jgi:hypothetical protein
MEIPSVGPEGKYAHISIGAEAAVEADFLAAEIKTFFQGGEIQKTEVYRLFDFVDVGISKIQA